MVNFSIKQISANEMNSSIDNFLRRRTVVKLWKV